MEDDNNVIKCRFRPTLHRDVERADVALVFGGDLAAVATCVSIHHLNDAHLVSVDLTERTPLIHHEHRSARVLCLLVWSAMAFPSLTFLLFEDD